MSTDKRQVKDMGLGEVLFQERSINQPQTGGGSRKAGLASWGIQAWN